MKTITKLIAIFALVAAACYGQAYTLATTTLGAALTATATTVTLASTSTMSGKGQGGQYDTVLYVDKEFMRVVSVVDSTHVTVLRAQGIGYGGRPMAHLNASIVYFAITNSAGVASSFFNNNSGPEVSGTCTASALTVLPNVYLFTGHKYTCMGTTGQWVQIDSPGTPVLGATYTVPAGAIVPPGTIFLTDTGTAAATSITTPVGWGVGMCITIIPGGAFTWTTAGNLRPAGTAVAGKALFFCYDGSKWDSSY